MGRPPKARELYDELRTLEAKAKTACRRTGQKYSRRDVARLAGGRGSSLDRRLGEWLHEEWDNAKTPASNSSEQLIAVVRLWSEWAGERCDESRWLTLLDEAQLPRTPPRRPEAVLTGAAVLDRLAAAGRQRMVSRWIAAGAEPNDATDCADDLSLGDPRAWWSRLPETGFAVLEGDLGSGKSLSVERLHAADIAAARTDPQAAIPVFLPARQVLADLPRAVEEAATPVGDPALRPVRLVLDGLDELGLTRGEDLLAQARTLAVLHPSWRVIVTTRRGFRLTGVPVDQRHVCPALSLEEADALIARLGGRAGALERVSTEVSQALRRPLFAVIAAALQREDRHLPARQVAFLHALAERGVRLSGAPEPQARRLLTRLAAASLAAGGRAPAAQLGDADSLETLRASRLVVIRGRTVEFALPVLEQYFAGQAVLAGELPDTVLEDPDQLAMWRGGLALAVADGSWDQGSDLIQRIAARWPGAAAWAVHEAVPGHRDLVAADPGDQPLPRLARAETVRRMQQAWDTWTDRLAPASGVLYSRGGPLTVDARWDDHRLSAQLLPRSGAGTPALQIPFEHRCLERDRRIRPVQPWYGLVAADHEAWPWHWALGLVANRLTDLCTNKDLPLPGCHPHTAERLYLTAKALLGRHERDHAPMPAEDALAVIRARLRRSSTAVRIGHNGRLVTTPAELRHLQETLESGSAVGSDGMLHRPYPEPDCGGEWIWNAYSPPQFHRLACQVLTAAVEIYRALVTAWFPLLHDTLGLTASAAQITGALQVPADPDEPPALLLSLRERIAPGAPLVDLTLVQGDDLLAMPARKLSAANGVGPAGPVSYWARPYTEHSMSEPELYGDTPAINYAYAWLHDDLARLHLADPPRWPGGL
ncbi:hypothetical protein ACFXOR_15995 [Streptomyces sp. NPDC059164]|uniref:hypothetical protein n=1 Tax=Streptomyces sp. NPDC059164 TaxID=3346750 RepID=UPI0036753004